MLVGGIVLLLVLFHEPKVEERISPDLSILLPSSPPAAEDLALPEPEVERVVDLRQQRREIQREIERASETLPRRPQMAQIQKLDNPWKAAFATRALIDEVTHNLNSVANVEQAIEYVGLVADRIDEFAALQRRTAELTESLDREERLAVAEIVKPSMLSLRNALQHASQANPAIFAVVNEPIEDLITDPVTSRTATGRLPQLSPTRYN